MKNKDLRKLTKVPAWKVVKNQEAVLKLQEAHLEEVLKLISLAKYSSKYPPQLNSIEKQISQILWSLDQLRNGKKKDSGRQAMRENISTEYELFRIELEKVKIETGFDLDNGSTWQ